MTRNVKKVLHICIIITIIIAIAFTALMFILGYIENGETNMPFEISKITIISTVDAQDVEDSSNRWNEKVSQNNDIYIDIKKNEEYSKNRIIKSVKINNFKIVKKPSKGDINIYKPTVNEVKTFENKQEYEISEITFEGDTKADIQNLKIANQGGRIAFRCANLDLGSYISNEETELNYDSLLSKMGISEKDLKATISFDIELLLTNGVSFNATAEVQTPVEGIVEKGRTSKEITDLNIIFKRVE